MRIPALALGIASLFFACPLQAQTRDPAWQGFESEQGRYKVSFPGRPAMTKGRLNAGAGFVISTRQTAHGANATYEVSHYDYPKDTVGKLGPAKIVDTARDGLVYVSKGKLDSEKPFALGKLSGRELEITGDDGTLYRIRLLLVQTRLYQLTAMARPPEQADAKRFFDSFQLTGVTPP